MLAEHPRLALLAERYPSAFRRVWKLGRIIVSRLAVVVLLPADVHTETAVIAGTISLCQAIITDVYAGRRTDTRTQRSQAAGAVPFLPEPPVKLVVHMKQQHHYRGEKDNVVNHDRNEEGIMGQRVLKEPLYEPRYTKHQNSHCYQ